MGFSSCSVFRLTQALGALIAAPLWLNALQPSHSVTQYGHSSWTSQDSQLTGAVHALAQTRDGSLWVGTEFGIVRFDGTIFSLPKPPQGAQLPDQVVALAAAPDGGLWIGTGKDLTYWKGDRLKHYLTKQKANGPGISSVLIDSSGTVWAGTAGFDSGAPCRVQGDRTTCYGPAEGYDGRFVLTLFEDRDLNLWIGGARGLYRWDSGRFRRYGDETTVQAIAQAPGGGLIIPSPGRLLLLLKDRLETYSNSEDIHKAHTRVLLSDRNGGVWIGTTGEGLLHLYQGRVDRFTQADGLSGNIVLALFEDREGNVWAGTDKGLDRFRDLPATTFSRREGLSTDGVVSVSASIHGGVWLGTTEGLNSIHDTGPGAEGQRSFGPIHSLFEDQSGALWVDSAHGLTFTASGKLQQLKLHDGQPVGSVTSAAQERTGAIWFSDARHGLTRVDKYQVAGVIPWSRFDNRIAWALGANPLTGGLLIGFAQGGVAALEKDQVTRWYTDREGLGSGAVTDLHFDMDGAAWIATEGGLSELKDGRIATLGLANGLPCTQIQTMVEDNDRNLWIVTPCGLLRLSRRDLTEWSANPKFRISPMVLGAHDGIRLRPRKYGFFRGAVKSTDGRLWFPEPDGVAVVDPQHLPYNSLTPPVEIHSVAVDDAAQAIHPGFSLPHISHDLQIDYTAFSFVDPERVRFKYRLEGYDKDWIDAGSRRRAIYPDLPPARYVFHVVARNNDGVWNNAGASLAFAVAPTFYQTLWFRLLSATAVLGLVWAAYKLRVKRLEAALSLRYEERMKERTRISRDLHDTLLQNIAAFAYELDALSKTVVNAPLSARDQLRDLRRQAERWLGQARQSIWELRLPASGEHDLATALQHAGNEILDGKNIAFKVGTSGRPHAPADETRQNLIRIVEEALRNAAAHSNATKIDVHLRWMARNQLCLRISDDGRGFDFEEASKKHGHLGLASMQERAREIGATFRIDASPGRGVTIEIQSRPHRPTV